MTGISTKEPFIAQLAGRWHLTHGCYYSDMSDPFAVSAYALEALPVVADRERHWAFFTRGDSGRPGFGDIWIAHAERREELRHITAVDYLARNILIRTLRSRLSAAYKGFNALLMRAGARDFQSGQRFDDSVFSADRIDIHYVFPKAWCQKHGKMPADYDSIVNKTPISLRTNRSIGGSAPSNYLARLRDQGSITDDALDEHLRTHMIDPALLRVDDFERFMTTRRGALLDLVADVIGGERVVRSSDVSVEAVDQDDVDDDDAAVQANPGETVVEAAE